MRQAAPQRQLLGCRFGMNTAASALMKGNRRAGNKSGQAFRSGAGAFSQASALGSHSWNL